MWEIKKQRDTNSDQNYCNNYANDTNANVHGVLNIAQLLQPIHTMNAEWAPGGRQPRD